MTDGGTEIARWLLRWISFGPRAPFQTWRDYLPFHRRKRGSE